MKNTHVCGIFENRLLRHFIVAAWTLLTVAGAIVAQSPSPAPSGPDASFAGYKVTSSSEFGFRGKDLDGSESKFRSDLNYKSGFRVFDSNLLLETENSKGKPFDSMLVSVSGWGADPTGLTRIKLDKFGVYKADFTVRRIQYFNDLANHVLNEHTQNTRRTMADLDITLFPQSETFRFLFGTSYGLSRGPGVYTTRAYGDEFPIDTFAKIRSNDYRFGAEGTLAGFNWGVTQGFRDFGDLSKFSLIAPTPGNNPANTSALATFSRIFPTNGNVSYTNARLHRTFAKRFDVTARAIYSVSRSEMEMIERITGRDQSNNFVDLDRFAIFAKTKRIQFRSDVGFTFMITDAARVSNTTTFDRFSISGDEDFEEAFYRRNAAGNPLATVVTRSTGYRLKHYRRLTNTAEFDYQFSNRLGFHVGYRYTKRNVEGAGVDNVLTSAPSPTNPLLINFEEHNTTHAGIGGVKIKPIKNWVIFADVEKGSADNVFTRVENYHYTNFRARSRWTLDDFTINVSAMTKDNTNPTFNIVAPTVDLVTRIRHRNFSGTLDWTPNSRFGFSGGYNYRYLTSYTPIIVPVTNVLRQGFSQFFVRDHYGFAEMTARVSSRLSIFGAYRVNRDLGQGSRASSVIEQVITSYPMRFDTPEIRAAIRLNDRIDWNIGYQYYNFKDVQTPVQNYRAHLPYTSIKVYFGSRALDR